MVLILGILVLASLPVLGMLLLSRYGTTASNRTSPLLLIVTFLIWAAAFYVLFAFAPHGKFDTLLIAGPAFLTYALFFKGTS